MRVNRRKPITAQFVSQTCSYDRRPCWNSVAWEVRVLDRTKTQVLFNMFACDTHRRSVELMAKERDD